MSARESDSNSWNFDIFVDHIFSSNYYGIDGEETRAHSLEDEFSQLSIGEVPESLPPRDEYLQVSSNIQDGHWPYYPGYRFGPEETYDNGPSKYYSSDGERSYEGQVGKWLNEMVPIPHVPKINGDIPSVDEATSDHQRLIDRLQLYDLVERKVEGDGNCQFRALSDQVYRTQEHHEFFRQQVVGQLEANPEMYKGYVLMEYGEYLNRMSKNGEWGDHVTLQAAADSLFTLVFGQKCITTQFLSKEIDSSDCKKEKKNNWWSFGNKRSYS